MVSIRKAIYGVVALVFLLTVCSVSAPEAFGQTKAIYSGYKGITIGMAQKDVREKLGEAKDETPAEDYWEFSDQESARVLYDDKKKVRAISVNFAAGETTTPTPEKVFGESAEAKPDGSIYKMVEYRKDGFWISYVRTAGEQPLVILTMQKLLR